MAAAADVEAAGSSEPTRIIKLQEIMKEMKMKPSGAQRGKGPVAERHLLAYECAQHDLKKRSGPWEWEVGDPELDKVRQFLRDYRDLGERMPSGWRQGR